jgi:predicted DNA-binding transcriptional regulator AlpA
MSDDRLIGAGKVAKLLGVCLKTVRRWQADTGPDRPFPQPVRLPSPSGGRPILRWRESEIRAFAGLEGG